MLHTSNPTLNLKSNIIENWINSSFEEYMQLLRKKFQNLKDQDILKLAISELYQRELEEEKEHSEWMEMLASNPSFDFLHDECEDIYSL